MKKILSIIPVLAVTFMIFSLGSCKEKDEKCHVNIYCKYSTTGLDTGMAAPYCSLTFGKDEFDLAEYEIKDTAITDANGFYAKTYTYESLLIVNATHEKRIIEVSYDGQDTTYIDEPYRGKGEVKLKSGETVDITVLMIKQ
jgi:hypothetical protein